MILSANIRFATIDELYLDPMNPRLGRHNTGWDVTQNRVLQLMESWALDELALSCLESGGIWIHEALLVIDREVYGGPGLVVVEGNRRLAALKYLHKDRKSVV